MRNILSTATPLAITILLTACGSSNNSPRDIPVTPPADASILAIGDSFFEFHVESMQSIPDEIGKALQMSVENRSMSGAVISGGSGVRNIKDQYEPGNWEWVVMDGGGNDLNDKCDCRACEQVINELIDMEAVTGELPQLVNTMLGNGHKVVFMMYPEILPEAEFGFAQCQDEFTELQYRVNELARKTEDFWLVNAGDVVPFGDTSYYLDDRVHPSTKATEIIGQHIADTISVNTPE